jgi:hypothetical protein
LVISLVRETTFLPEDLPSPNVNDIVKLDEN